MNKTIIVTLAVALLGIVGVGGFMLMNQNKTTTPSNPVSTTTKTDASTQKKSLKDFLTLAGNQECTFKDEAGNGGVVYGQNGKVRGDFTSMVNGVGTNSHMFSDGSTVYIWMDGQTQGFKTSLAAVSQLSTSENVQTMDVNKQVDYECKTGSPNASLFATPTTVTFTDFSEMMNSVPATIKAGESMEAGPSAQNMKAAQCAACDQLSGSSQTQCKQALGC